MHLVDRPAVGEFNGIPFGQGQLYHDEYRDARTVRWDEPHLRVTRLRLLSDLGLGWWDVSYCHGTLCHTGELVRVELPFNQLPKRGWKRAIVQYAIRDGIYAHGLGVLSNVSTLC
jgi:hypothetical protein